MIKVAKACLGDEEMNEVKEAFEYGYFGLAYKVSDFEKNLQEYMSTEHVIAVNSGTSALHLALEAIGVTEGDEVIVPSMTFVASFQAISQTGAKPVACDVLPGSLLMDINDVKRRITSKTKAIMPVHYGGSVCDMDALMKIHDETGIRIIEDAAHAFGSSYKGRLVGSFGDITCFSFDSIKVITCGEGGAIVCREEVLANKLRQQRLLGIDRKSYAKDWRERGWFYEVNLPGFRYHMSNINAAIGLAQLKKIDKFVARRREICKKYDAAFKGLQWLECRIANYDEIAPFIYVVCVKDGLRDQFMNYLKTKEIETGVSYIPNHIQPLYKNENTILPITDAIFNEVLTLPLHYALTDADVDKVIKAVVNFR